MWGRSERDGTVQSGEEKAQADIIDVSEIIFNFKDDQTLEFP